MAEQTTFEALTTARLCDWFRVSQAKRGPRVLYCCKVCHTIRCAKVCPLDKPKECDETPATLKCSKG